jgi:hypothetical protein
MLDNAKLVIQLSHTTALRVKGGVERAAIATALTVFIF